MSRVAKWEAFIAQLSRRLHAKVDPLAAPERVYALYATQLAQEGLKPATIQQHISSIRSWHADNGEPAPAQTGLLKRVIRGVNLNPLHAPQRETAPPRFPITTAVLMRMRGFIDLQTWGGALIWLAFLLGTLGLPKVTHSFPPHSQRCTVRVQGVIGRRWRLVRQTRRRG